MANYKTEVEAVDALSIAYEEIRKEIAKVIVGQDEVVKSVLISIFSNGHCLLVGVPGLAKTLLVQTVANVLDLSFNRIQFTPDLMPSDIIGSEILGEDRNFKFIKGPVFSNIILADEINRTPPKTQAALLEAMQEKSVTAAGVTHHLPKPFFVLATQNPIEQEGTYRLPEAQLDRFLFKINVGYPNLLQEIQIIKNQHENRLGDKTDAVQKVITGNQLKNYQEIVKNVLVEPQLLEYIAKIIVNTRENQFLYLGASPRASLALLTASKSFAAIRGRDFVTPEDIKEASTAVLRHRIMVSPEREMEGLTADEIIRQILETIEIPR